MGLLKGLKSVKQRVASILNDTGAVPPASFAEVFKKECEFINSRRVLLSEAKLIPPNAPGARKAENQDDQAGLLEDHVGLAISGGGIRSATLGLGALQGLAQVGILPRLDYISTVSGGGYIGSWLSAWIRTHGFENVNDVLLPARYRGPHEGKSEPAQISHLRYYSNYLVPIPGIFSIDGWTILAIFLRNLVLNISVFVLALFSLFCALRIVVERYSIYGNTAIPLDDWFVSWHSQIICWGIVLCTTFSIFFLKRIADGLASHQTQRNFSLHLLLAKLFILLSAFYSSLLFTIPLFQDAATKGDYVVYFFVAWVLWCSFSNGISGFVLMKRKKVGTLTGIIAGLMGGCVTFGVLYLTHTSFTGIHIAVAATLYVPLIICCNVFTNCIHVGFMGDSLDEQQREWWSRINAESVYFAALWLFFVSLIVFGPWLVKSIAEQNWSTYVFGGGWVGTTLIGIISAKSKDTQDEKTNGVKSFLAKIAPYIFITGMLAMVATAATALMYYVQDKFVINRKDVEPESFAARTAYKLLTDLNDQKMDLWKDPIPISVSFGLIVAMLVFFGLSYILARRIGLNQFTLHNMYANRLVRCYLGAVRARDPNVISNIDPQDDVQFSSLQTVAHSAKSGSIPGPFHIINAAINCRVGKIEHGSEAGSLGLKDRLADSFIFTPIYSGSSRTGYRKTENFYGNLKLGTAMSVSGAAVSPNMGFHTSPAVTALLTLFNVRLGAWFGNPFHEKAAKTVNPSNWFYMFRELLGYTDTQSEYVYISDGGHFENMGVYELLRRRCRFIIACDAGADDQNLGYLVRKARMDFGIQIDIDNADTKRNATGFCGSHIALGRIKYANIHPPVTPETEPLMGDPGYHYQDNEGILVYIRTSLTGDEPVDLLNYRSENPDFPDESTVDQFFSEAQFESYRVLGHHSVVKLFEGVKFRSPNGPVVMFLHNPHAGEGAPNQSESLNDNYWEITSARTNHKLLQSSTRSIFEDLYEHWLANPLKELDSTEFVTTYFKIMEDIRGNTHLHRLAEELLDFEKNNAKDENEVLILNAEKIMVLRMAYLLHSIWTQRKLHTYGLHPANRGWVNIFKRWTASATFRTHWYECSEQFAPSFCKYLDYVQSGSSLNNSD